MRSWSCDGDSSTYKEQNHAVNKDVFKMNCRSQDYFCICIYNSILFSLLSCLTSRRDGQWTLGFRLDLGSLGDQWVDRAAHCWVSTGILKDIWERVMEQTFNCRGYGFLNASLNQIRRENNKLLNHACFVVHAFCAKPIIPLILSHTSLPIHLSICPLVLPLDRLFIESDRHFSFPRSHHTERPRGIHIIKSQR